MTAWQLRQRGEDSPGHEAQSTATTAEGGRRLEQRYNAAEVKKDVAINPLLKGLMANAKAVLWTSEKRRTDLSQKQKDKEAENFWDYKNQSRSFWSVLATKNLDLLPCQEIAEVFISSVEIAVLRCI